VWKGLVNAGVREIGKPEFAVAGQTESVVKFGDGCNPD